MIARCLALLVATLVSTGSIYGITYAARHHHSESLQVSCPRDSARETK